jgi:hypothetical protein
VGQDPSERLKPTPEEGGTCEGGPVEPVPEGPGSEEETRGNSGGGGVVNGEVQPQEKRQVSKIAVAHLACELGVQAKLCQF